ncbi:MAG: hypothetical protein Q9222_004892 [Ikaeria aurantiellina]
MVKADPKADYYADLELPPAASELDIKRQFRKLECNSKFQAIQSAHEVLTDPTQRAKYDADRIRNGMLHTYTSPVRPNPPPRAAASNFPPPPQRTAQASSKPNFAPPPSSGANRYSSYMRADAKNTYQSPADEAKARANAFKAWEQMRHGPGVPPQSRPVPPRPTKTNAFQPGREAGSYPPKDPPPRPAWDQSKESNPGFPKMTRSNTTRVPKKGGFAPGFSVGDEPPARNTSAYFNVSKGERPDASKPTFQSRPAPPPPPPPPPPSNQRDTKRPDPLKPFRPQSGFEDMLNNSDRLSTPYATGGGEKTYFTSAGFSRPNSSRDSTIPRGGNDGEPLSNDSPSRTPASAASYRGHHSASPKLRNSRPVSLSSSSSSSSDESLREGVEQLYTSAGKASKGQNRHQNGHLKPTYKPFINVDSMENEPGLPPRRQSDAADRQQSHLGQQPQSGGSHIDPNLTEGFMEHRLRHEAERKHGVNHSVDSSPHRLQANQPQQRPLHRPKSWHDKYGTAGQDEAKDNMNRPATGDQPVKRSIPLATTAYPKASFPNWACPSSIPPLRKQTFTQGIFGKKPDISLTPKHLSARNADKNVRGSFTFPQNANGKPIHPPPLRSHSSDTINVHFSPHDWHGKFTGRPEEYFDPPSGSTNASRRKLSPTRRQPQSASQSRPASAVHEAESPKADPSMPPPPTEPTQRESYSPDKWAHYFKPGTLNWPPPPPPPPTGPANRAVSRKRPKTPSRRGSRVVFKRAAVPKPASVTPIVDDDTTSSNLESSSGQSSGNGSAMDLDPGTSPPDGDRRSNGILHQPMDTTPRPPVPPRPTIPSHAPPPPPPPAQDKSHLDLGNLQNVAPFAPNQQGIKDLNDLTTALPFESKSSTQAAGAHLPSPQKLELPNPPKAPVAPEKLTQGSWERYLAAMRAYMFGWNAFNTQMLAHFNERQAGVESTLKPEWLGAVGEGSEKWGFGKYMAGVEEDFRVREHWNVSWERHRECMRTLGGMREKILRGGMGRGKG